MWCTGPRKRASTPSGGDRPSDGRRRPDQPLRVFDEADVDAALARFERTEPADTAAGKRGKPSGRALPGVLRGPRLGRVAEVLADDISSRRSPSGGERRDPTRPRCRDRGFAGDRRRRGHVRDVDRHRNPRASASSSRVPARVRDQRTRGVPHEVLGVVEINADDGSRRSSCSISTTSTPPSPSSTRATSPAKRPPMRTRGR